jgi:hypothetical protein
MCGPDLGPRHRAQHIVLHPPAICPLRSKRRRRRGLSEVGLHVDLRHTVRYQRMFRTVHQLTVVMGMEPLRQYPCCHPHWISATCAQRTPIRSKREYEIVVRRSILRRGRNHPDTTAKEIRKWGVGEEGEGGMPPCFEAIPPRGRYREDSDWLSGSFARYVGVAFHCTPPTQFNVDKRCGQRCGRSLRSRSGNCGANVLQTCRHKNGPTSIRGAMSGQRCLGKVSGT